MNIRILNIILLLLISSTIFAQEAKIVGGAVVKFVGSSNAELNADLTNESSSFTTESSSTFSFDSDLTSTGVITSQGRIYSIGSNSQSITVLNTDLFEDVRFEKSSNSITLAPSVTWTINNLTFNSNTQGYIQARNNNLVRVENSILRSNFGHVDGPLAIFFNAGDQANSTFTVGYGDQYTPIEYDAQGVGGVAGHIQAESNTLTLDVLASTLDPEQVVEREYDLIVPGWSSYDLGASTSFNMIIHYINPDDIRNGANSNTFETARYNDPQWSYPLLISGNRTNSSVQSLSNRDFGTFVVGPEDYFLELYSVASGSYSDGSNWSLVGYGSTLTVPFSPRPRDIVYIGDDQEITLYEDISKLAQRSVTVEQAGPSGESGQLTMGEYILSGSGTFSLLSGGILSLGDASGITNPPTAAGNIQTFQRNYNPGNHKNGNFIFTHSNPGDVGDGFPANVNNLTIDASSVVAILSDVNIANDLTVNSGTFDLDDNVATGTASGTFTLAANSRLVIGDINDLSVSIPSFQEYSIDSQSEVEFDGSTQTLSNFPPNFNTSLGYGFVYLSNAGTKTVATNMRIRNNLYIYNSAYFLNQAGVNDLQVNGSVINDNSSLENQGVIKIGQ